MPFIIISNFIPRKIDAFLQSKLKGKAPDRATLKKLSDALLRRGFSWQDIRPALNRLGEEIDE